MERQEDGPPLLDVFPHQLAARLELGRSDPSGRVERLLSEPGGVEGDDGDLRGRKRRERIGRLGAAHAPAVGAHDPQEPGGLHRFRRPDVVVSGDDGELARVRPPAEELRGPLELARPRRRASGRRSPRGGRPGPPRGPRGSAGPAGSSAGRSPGEGSRCAGIGRGRRDGGRIRGRGASGRMLSAAGRSVKRRGGRLTAPFPVLDRPPGSRRISSLRRSRPSPRNTRRSTPCRRRRKRLLGPRSHRRWARRPSSTRRTSRRSSPSSRSATRSSSPAACFRWRWAARRPSPSSRTRSGTSRSSGSSRSGAPRRKIPAPPTSTPSAPSPGS